MTDDLVKRLRADVEEFDGCCGELATIAADRIEWMQDVIARIQHTNLRRDMNIETRTKEIDRMCKEKWTEK